jgi:hypothetical protein
MSPSLEVMRQALTDHHTNIQLEMSKNDADIAAVDALIAVMQSRAQREMCTSDDGDNVVEQTERLFASATGQQSLPVGRRLGLAAAQVRTISSQSSSLPAGDLRSSIRTNNNGRSELAAVGDDDMQFVGEIVGAVVDEAAKLDEGLMEVLAGRLPLDSLQTQKVLESFDCFAVAMDTLCSFVFN